MQFDQNTIKIACFEYSGGGLKGLENYEILTPLF